VRKTSTIISDLKRRELATIEQIQNIDRKITALNVARRQRANAVKEFGRRLIHLSNPT